MKYYVLAMLAVSFTACGTQNSSKAMSSANSVQAHWGTDKHVRFFNDSRPVDGDLRELLFDLNSKGKYDISLHILESGFSPSGGQKESTKQIAQSLDCKNTFVNNSDVQMVRCHKFDPVDETNLFVELTMNSSGTYDAMEYEPAVIDGNQIPTDLGKDFALQAN